MVANMPNLGTVDAVGKQFNTNIFEKVSKKVGKAGKAALNTGGPARVTDVGGFNFRTTRSDPRGPRRVSGSIEAPRQPRAALTQAPKALPAGPTKAPAGGFATPYNGAPRAPIAAIGSGRKPIATPYHGGNRVIPMSSNAALTNRVNPNMSFSSAPSTHTPLNRTQFNQPSTTPFSPPAASAPSTQTPPPIHSQQFSNVTPKSTGPYPVHTPPAGSSTTPLPNLTAAQSSPGKPNTFTVGSRSIKGGGIAAMGSQLEAGLMNRPINTPAKKRRV